VVCKRNKGIKLSEKERERHTHACFSVLVLGRRRTVDMKIVNDGIEGKACILIHILMYFNPKYN